MRCQKHDPPSLCPCRTIASAVTAPRVSIETRGAKMPWAPRAALPLGAGPPVTVSSSWPELRVNAILTGLSLLFRQACRVPFSYDDVVRFQMNFLSVVHLKPYFAFESDAVVDCLGGVHARTVWLHRRRQIGDVLRELLETRDRIDAHHHRIREQR